MAAPRNDNVKEKILDAATGLLDTQTFADISLAEIAAAAGATLAPPARAAAPSTPLLAGLID